MLFIHGFKTLAALNIFANMANDRILKKKKNKFACFETNLSTDNSFNILSI